MGMYPESMGPKVTLTQLRALLAVVEHGTYSAAALELDQSQSTLSHAVAELERALGAKLLERGRHGATPTTLGLRVLKHAREALTAVEALEQEAMLERQGLTGTIRVISLRSIATHLLPPVLHRFRLEHPGVQFELLEEGPEDDRMDAAVRDGRADVGLLDLPTNDDLLEFELARDEYVLLWPHEPKRTRPPTWADIAAKPYIACDSGCMRHLRAHWAEHGLRLEGEYRIRQDSVIVSMVAQGLGISVLPTLAIHPLPAGVTAYPLPAPLERRLGIAVTRRKMTVPAIRAFVQALRDEVEPALVTLTEQTRSLAMAAD